jgi:uncharacterized protein (DUF1684 family)
VFGQSAGSERTRPTLRVYRRISLAFLATALAYACTSGPSAPDEDTAGYRKVIQDARAEKDRVYGSDPELIPVAKRATLLPLKYYDVDPAYQVPASLKLSPDRPVYDMPTSTGANRKMQRVGILEFTLQGQQMSLEAFVEDGTRQITSLFVPFADLTTAKETYGAGRYLDLKPTATGFYVIDFNRAYNPTCAYNPTWECPYPPQANRLKVAIRAGEKAPAESHDDVKAPAA